MPIDARIPLGVTGIDPNGFTNALATGMKMRAVQNESERLARKDEAADTKRNELSTYLSGDRSEEARRRLAIAAPEAALEIEKSAGTAALNATKLETAKMDGLVKKVELGAQLLSGASDQASYDEARTTATQAGLDTKAWPEQYFPDWVAQNRARALKVKDQFDLELRTLNTESQIADREGRRTDTALYREGLDADRDAARTETNRHNLVQESKKPGGGLSITGYDDKGRPLIQVGGAAPLGKPAVNILEEKQIQGIDALARLDEIERVSDPKLLTYQNKAKDFALGVKSKLGGEMDPEQAQFRNQVTDMRQSTMENLSRTIKDLTGAAMQLSEVPRIEATIPTMHDDPDQFPRKLKNATRLIRNSIIRGQIAREQGMDPLNTGIDLGDTKTLMDKREEQLKRHYGARAQGMDPAQVEAAIEKQIRQEFGY